MKTRFWKFEFADALGDCGAFTPTEIATLRYLCDRADEKGKCYPTLKTINEACGRSGSYPMTAHIKKAEELGFLKVGGHGRKRIYYLNTSIQGIKSAVKSASQQQVSNSKSADTTPKSAETGGSSQHQSPTNTSINTSKEEINMKTNLSKKNLLKEMVEDSKGVVPLDYIPQRVWNDNFPDLLREAKLRYNFLVSLGVNKNLPFEDKQTQRWFLDWVQTSDPIFETAVLLMGKPTMKDLVKTPLGKLWGAVENQKYSELGAREEQSGFDLLTLLFNLQRYKWDNPNHPLLNNYRKWFESKKVSV